MYIDKNIEIGVSEQDYRSAKALAEGALPNGKKYVAHIYSVTCGFRMITFVMKGIKSKEEITKNGYFLSYVYNVEAPHFSELGEVYLEYNKETEKVERVG